MQMYLKTVLITLVMLQKQSCHFQPEAWKGYHLPLIGSGPTVRDCKQISNLYTTDLAVKIKSLIYWNNMVNI